MPFTAALNSRCRALAALVFAVTFMLVALGPATAADAPASSTAFPPVVAASLAIDTPLGYPMGVAVDAAGRIVFADSQQGMIERIESDGTISLLYESGQVDLKDAPPGSPSFIQPQSIAMGTDGSVIFTDPQNHRVLSLDRAGSLHTVAGTGFPGESAPGIRATSAGLRGPRGIALDSAGRVVIADSGNHRILRVDQDGTISVMAGQDGSRSKRLVDPVCVLPSTHGGILVVDRARGTVDRIPASGEFERIIGGGKLEPAENASAADVRLVAPTGVTETTDGATYVADPGGNRVYRIRDGKVHVAMSGPASAFSPVALAAVPGGGIVVADWSGHRIDLLEADGRVTAMAGNGEDAASTARAPKVDDDPVPEAPAGIVATGSSILIADPRQNRIVEARREGSPLVWIAAEPSESLPEPRIATPRLFRPSGLVLQPDRTMLFSEVRSHRIRRLDPKGRIGTVAGEGVAGAGDTATRVRLNAPTGLVRDTAGNLYFSDTLNDRVRRIRPDGRTETVVGRATTPSNSSGKPPVTVAEVGLQHPEGLAIGPDSALIVADTGHSRVVRVSPTGDVTPVAGGGIGSPTVGRLATSCRLLEPVAVASGPNGRLAIADAADGRVWIVDGSGTIKTLVGSGPSSGDSPVETAGSAPEQTELVRPYGVCYDAAGNLWIVMETGVAMWDTAGHFRTIVPRDLWDPSASQPATGSWTDRLRHAFVWHDEGDRGDLRWIQRPTVSAVSPGMAMIVWSTDSPSTGVVDYGDGDEFDHRVVVSAPSSPVAVTLSGLRPGHAYRFRVAVGNRLPDGRPVLDSGTLSFTTPVDPHGTKVIKAVRHPLASPVRSLALPPAVPASPLRSSVKAGRSAH